MTSSILLDLSSYAGIAASGLLKINYLFGMLIGISYTRIAFFKKLLTFFKNWNVYSWHNRTAYITLAFVLLHPVVLLLDPATKFRFMDRIFLLNAPTQRMYVALGTIAMAAILMVIVTTQKAVKRGLTFRLWKKIHLISYLTGLLFIFHGIMMDPQLKIRPVDFLDAEKIATEACLLVLLVATFYRVRFELLNRHSSRFYSLSISKIITETADAKTLVLDIRKKITKLFCYSPGQFVEIKTTINGQEYNRAHSLSSSLYSVDGLHLMVKRIHDGVVSGFLHDNLDVGDVLQVLPPLDNFLDETHSRITHLVLFAGGSGIIPIYSIIKSLLHDQPKISFSLIYANRSLNDIIFKQQLKHLQINYPDSLSVTHILSVADNSWEGLRGRLDQRRIQEFLKPWKALPILQTQYYICGPSPLMELIEYELLASSIPAKLIYIEKFISIGKTEDPVEVGEVASQMVTGGAILNARFYGVENLTFCEKNQNLLDVLLAAGINAPYSYKEGLNSTCKVKLFKGRVVMFKNASLSDYDLKDSKILSCQAIPLSDAISIDCDKPQS